ncbi:aminoacyl-tRNA hydrolase [Campylobacter sp. RM16187]|uniref:aminoacyl-tRNA hydrolase n=1 Tax=Campylobacter sp. RM16187 TaxID=1660063 RepID=UPI0021B55A2F|nr:aminoacyl-tRNA hydrolase [Campylobacter sp. RM16187]QKG28567.1 peptidyl-tRNA hydrolase [Campylobacter sp. RM16187]
MILIVGLGNPGSQYEKTRHNIGFMLIDLLKNEKFTDVTSSKFQGELFKFSNLLLLKPQTFMNLSGNSVKAVKDFYKPERIIVIHDDLDLKLGVVKFKIGGSSGGHNGIKSIDSLIESDYERVRVGIGRAQNSSVTGHVLGNFSQDESECLNKVLNYTKEAVIELIKSDINTISQKYSSKKGICT